MTRLVIILESLLSRYLSAVIEGAFEIIHTSELRTFSQDFAALHQRNTMLVYPVSKLYERYKFLRAQSWIMLATFDRTQWTVEQTLARIADVLTAHRPCEEHSMASAAETSATTAVVPDFTGEAWRFKAYTELMVALRDGELFATGRRSTTRNIPGYWPGVHDAWIMHSGRYELITPEEWRAGMFHENKLASLSWEFIDIRIPRYMVIAIWPQPIAPQILRKDETLYTTPYIELLHNSVSEFGISDQSQPKKECLVDWFKAQKVDGEPLSDNLANVMATIVRLPSSQRGGARRAGQ